MKQKQSKSARDRAIGIIGPGAVAKLEAAGFAIVDRAALEKLRTQLEDRHDKATRPSL